MRKLVRVKEFRDRARVTAIAQHPDLDRGDVTILRQRIELRPQFRARCVVDSLDALRVLHRQRGDCRNAVAAVRCECLQVRRCPRPTRGIEARNRQENRRRTVPVVRHLSFFFPLAAAYAALLLGFRFATTGFPRCFSTIPSSQAKIAGHAPQKRSERPGNCECTRAEFSAQEKS